jgi:hypothetical protein
MSENLQDKPGSAEQHLNSQPEVPQGRSLFILKATANLAGVARRRRRAGGDPGFGHQDTSPGGASDGTGRNRH